MIRTVRTVRTVFFKSILTVTAARERNPDASDLWKLWPTNQTKERILMSFEQEAPSKLTEAQKEMVRNVREMDKKAKGL